MITLTLAAIALLALLAHTSGRRERTDGGWLVAALESRGIVVAVFACTFVVLWYSWASLNPPAVVHDEMSYLLQAQIFARGKWALPSPPLPLFWEQPHVLTEPTLASKYFPGHALLMSVGALFKWPALMPLVLQSTIAALMVILARRLASGAVALLSWIIWLFSPMVLYFGATYFSESTTTVCWLGGWYALLEWRRTRSLKWIVLLALFTGWDAITRPLTGLAYAIPVGVVVLYDVARLRRWRDLAVAFAVGTAVVSLLAVWSANTTGNWRLTPLTQYTREYMPYDIPGFGLDTTPPTHSLTPDQVQINYIYSAFHVNHFPSTLLPTLVERARNLWISMWGTTSGVVSVFALLGLVTLSAEGIFALASSVFLVLVYLSFATPAQWTLYYYETTPALAFVSACGMAWAASMIGRPRGTSSSPTYDWRSARWSRALVAAAGVLVLPGLVAMQIIHGQHIGDRKFLTRFDALLATIHDDRAVVFVRYAATHNPHVTFVRNVANPDRERIWVVYDRGDAENARLLALSNHRKAYLFDELKGQTYVYEPR